MENVWSSVENMSGLSIMYETLLTMCGALYRLCGALLTMC